MYFINMHRHVDNEYSKFQTVCAASKVLQNYNDLGLKELTNMGSCQNKCKKSNIVLQNYNDLGMKGLTNMGSCQNKCKKSNIGTCTYITIPTQNIQNQ